MAQSRVLPIEHSNPLPIVFISLKIRGGGRVVFVSVAYSRLG